MICCDTCPFEPTCEEVELMDDDWGDAEYVQDPGAFEWGDDE
jgi:hypothetical protein